MTTLAQMADGLQDRLQTVALFDGMVTREVRRPPQFPAAILLPPPIPDYGLSLNGLGAELVFPVLILVGTGEAEKQSDLWPLLDWTGSQSVPAAIAADPSLGGLSVSARVRSSEAPGLVELPDGTAAYGVQLNIDIFAT